MLARGKPATEFFSNKGASFVCYEVIYVVPISQASKKNIKHFALPALVTHVSRTCQDRQGGKQGCYLLCGVVVM